jgi:hypothetical protein
MTAVTDSALGSAEGVWQSLEEQGTASLTASSHGRPAGRPVEQAIDSLIAPGSHFRASETFGGALEGVEVSGGGTPSRRPGLAPDMRWWRIAVRRP